MGLQEALRRCDGVTVRTSDPPCERDVINLAIRDMLGNPAQREALALFCRSAPIVKPFIVAVLRAYAAAGS